MWFAHVTVANVVVRDDKFLMVKEMQDGRLVFNQPAGHLEDGETLIQAVVRETLEETCWQVRPYMALGVSQFKTANGATYIRHTFVSEPVAYQDNVKRDPDIVDTCWMSASEIVRNSESVRSPLVLKDLERYQNGARFPINELYFDTL